MSHATSDCSFGTSSSTGRVAKKPLLRATAVFLCHARNIPPLKISWGARRFREDAANTQRIARFVLRAVRHLIVEGTEAVLAVPLGLLAHVVDRKAEHLGERLSGHCVTSGGVRHFTTIPSSAILGYPLTSV